MIYDWKNEYEVDLGIITDPAGNKSLRDKQFVGREIKCLMFGPVLDTRLRYEVTDCMFKDCTLTDGLFEINDGVAVRNVIFENLNKPATLNISSGALLDRVTLKGKYRSYGLWLKPTPIDKEDVVGKARFDAFRQRIEAELPNIEYMLDIRDYDAPEVEIYGIPASKILLNPERHVVVRRDWVKKFDWNEGELSSFTTWRICLRRLIVNNLDDGVFGLPDKRHRGYDKAMAEYATLKRMGLI